MQAYEPSKYEILNEILLTEGTNLIRKSIKHPELLDQSTLSVSVNPFNPSDSEYLTRAFLGGPSHMEHFDTAELVRGKHMDIEEAPSYGVLAKSALR